MDEGGDKKTIDGIKSFGFAFFLFSFLLPRSYLRRLGVQRVRGRRRQAASIIHGDGREFIEAVTFGRRESVEREKRRSSEFFSSAVVRRRRRE